MKSNNGVQTQLKTAIIDLVLSNFHAYELVMQTEITLLKSTTSPFASYKKATLEELATLRNFDEQMIANILYTREIKNRFKEQFEEILKPYKAIHFKKVQIYKVLSEMSLQELRNILKEGDLFATLKNKIPSLDMYTIVNGKKKYEPITIISFFPCHFDDNYDKAMVDYIGEAGFVGSNVLRLPVTNYIGKFILALLLEKKIDCIINYYTDGESENDWHNFSYHLTYHLTNDQKEEMSKLLTNDKGNVPKNYVNSGFGGFDNREVMDILKNASLKKFQASALNSLNEISNEIKKYE